MKEKLSFIVLCVIGIFLVFQFMPGDNENDTKPYTQSVKVYVPDNMTIISSKFIGDFKKIPLEEFQEIVKKENPQTFMRIKHEKY